MPTCPYVKQAERFITCNNLTLTRTGNGSGLSHLNDGSFVHLFTFRLTNKTTGKWAKFHFTDSINNYKNGDLPDNYSFLASLWLDHAEDYEDFCDCFGYEAIDEDTGRNNKAHVKVWNAVKAQNIKILRVLDQDQIDELHEIS